MPISRMRSRRPPISTSIVSPSTTSVDGRETVSGWSWCHRCAGRDATPAPITVAAKRT
jgi:hypothetical protein